MTTQFTKILLATFCLFGMNWCLGNFAATCTNIHLQNNILWRAAAKLTALSITAASILFPLSPTRTAGLDGLPATISFPAIPLL